MKEIEEKIKINPVQVIESLESDIIKLDNEKNELEIDVNKEKMRLVKEKSPCLDIYV